MSSGPFHIDRSLTVVARTTHYQSFSKGYTIISGYRLLENTHILPGKAGSESIVIAFTRVFLYACIHLQMPMIRHIQFYALIEWIASIAILNLITPAII